MDYPERPSHFAHRFVRLLTKSAAAQELGGQVCWLLTVIALQEDAKRYRGAVTFYNPQIMPLVGASGKDALSRIRNRAIEEGWLHYEPGCKGVPCKYWVLIPEEYEGVHDSPMDESADHLMSRNHATNRTETAPESNPATKLQTGRKPRQKAWQKPRSQPDEIQDDNPAPYKPTPTTNPSASASSSAQAGSGSGGTVPSAELVQAVEAAGVEDLSCLKTALQTGLSEVEIHLLIVHFVENAAAKGWKPHALHYRLRNGLPGQAVDHGWPAAAKPRGQPSPKAEAFASEAEAEKQRQREELEQLESTYGGQLDRILSDDYAINGLIGELSRALRTLIEKRGGSKSRSNRLTLLTALRDREQRKAAG